MSDNAETVIIEAETAENPLGKCAGKTKTIMALMEKGMDARTALIVGTGNIDPHRNTVTQVKKKYEKWSLARPAMVKLAHQAVQETLAMKPIITSDGKEIHPSHTNRLAAAAMVADRAEPVVRQNVNLNLNAEISPVDLDRYR
jgi:hypothetical protein